MAYSLTGLRAASHHTDPAIAGKSA